MAYERFISPGPSVATLWTRYYFSLKAHALIGDILDLDEEKDAAKLLDGNINTVWCAAILYQFCWDKQVNACKRPLRYSKGHGSIVVSY
ncbi:uncharacterized protein CC84DRAFT_1093040 [Paraphaeosphaeria sporulosa]|uniref:Uncharacterized protein n=1 Tax=Paraphaeosphaeria sporulosa TaxID=1460663 RepID=A0A177CDD0_9PLEO|nr:uncharacterized protein CC84DRAFT_1093040 [Paraphaeosphaeria sporulosa]OAG04892.1 hypothetical protein CC84DRAFT_1093040 [Paraphaeosphaeria sporulosa]